MSTPDPPTGLLHDPQVRQRTAVGCIVAGVVVFAVAMLTTSTAGAGDRPGATPTVAMNTSAPVELNSLQPPSGTAGNAAAGLETLTAEPVHVAKPAPAGMKAIEALVADGIPVVALNAYRVAAARVAHADPSCGIEWELLAAIGRLESDHGRLGGAVLNSDGSTTPRIVGPALNGKGSPYVPAPANGTALDGDAKYTHPLGPMQFIPQTWSYYGADATGDHVADVFNINDAALGAARYLCATGGDLKTAHGQRKALLAYLHSDGYVAQLRALAVAYHSDVAPSGSPDGDTTSALPPVVTSDLPVNPADPPAAQQRVRAAGSASASATKSSSAPPDNVGQGGPPPVVSHRMTPGPTIDGTATHSRAPRHTKTPTASHSATKSATPTAPATSNTPTTSAPPPTSSSPPPPPQTSNTPSPTPTKKCLLWNLKHTRCLLYRN